MNTSECGARRCLAWNIGVCLTIVGAAWALVEAAGCSSSPSNSAREETVYRLPPLPAVPPGVEPFTLLKTSDRILFLGDDLTRLGFYTRAVASALMSIKPEASLRFYNGGYNGLTSGTARDKADELLDIVHPTMVFICLGLNDPVRAATQPAESVVLKFKENLNALVIHIKQFSGVRMVVVLSPPAIQEAPLDNALARYNETYKAMAAAAGEVAAAQQVVFGNLYDYTQAFNDASAGANVRLSFSGNLPNEPGHMVIASIILRGSGVTGAQLEQAHWSPLAARSMAAFRRIWEMSMATRSAEEQTRHLQMADQSRDLYEGLRNFDDQFFRAWRLAGPNTQPTRAQVLSDADAQWTHLEHLAQGLARENAGNTSVPQAGH